MCTGAPARVLSVDGDVALVDVDGRTIPVSLVVLDEAARIGDWLLVHSGLAVARIDDQDLPLLLQRRGDRP